MWNRPWQGPHVLPTPHAFPGASLSGPQRPGAPGFPVFGPAGPGNISMMKIEPVIINPNEGKTPQKVYVNVHVILIGTVLI